MVVNKGDTISVGANQLTDKEITVQWSQDWGKQKSVQYYSVPFTIGGEESIIFIEKSRLDQFKQKCSKSDDNLTVQVDDSFQYGQNRDKTARWLAFHDKNYKMFQWRFVEGLAAKIGQAALSIAGGFFKGIDFGQFSKVLGNPLHNF